MEKTKDIKCKQKGERKKKASPQKKEYKCNTPEEQKRYKCKQGDKGTKNTKGEKGVSGGAKKRYKYKQPKPTRKASAFVCLHLYHFFLHSPKYPLFPFCVFFFDVPLSPCLHLYLSFFCTSGVLHLYSFVPCCFFFLSPFCLHLWTGLSCYVETLHL